MQQFHWIVSNSRTAALAEAQRRGCDPIYSTSGFRADSVDASFLDHDNAADDAVGLNRIFNTNFGRHRGDETTKLMETLEREGCTGPVAFITIVQDHSASEFHWAELMDKWVIYFSALDDETRRRVQTMEGQLLGSKTILQATTVTALLEVNGKVRSKAIKSPKKDRSRDPRQSRPAGDRPRGPRPPAPGKELATSMSGRQIEVSKPRRGQEPAPKFHERNAPAPKFHEKPTKAMEGPKATPVELQDWQKKLSGHFGGGNG